MAHSIKLGTISKHEESTKRPNTTGWTEYLVVFKDGTDIVNPTITISAALSTVSGYNYGYMLGRYYWIRNITSYRNDYVILDLETDVLATYKTQIGNTSLYILRASAENDGHITDNLYPLSYDPLHSFDTLFSEPSGGVYVVTMAASSGGGSITYEFSAAEFSTFINSLLGVFDTLDFTTTENAIKNSMFTPLDYIYSCFYIPGSGFSGTTVANIKVGRWDSGASGKRLTNVISTSTASATIQHHNLAATRGDYLNLNPYTYIELNAPPFGIYQLNAAKLGKESTLSATLKIDASTGIGRLILTTSTSIILDVSCEYGATVPLTQNAISFSAAGGILGGALTAGMGAVTGNPMAAVGGLGSMIGTAAGTLGGTACSFGGLGSRAKYGNINVRYMFWPVVDEDNAHNGRPLCKLRAPANLTGYMVAQIGDVNIPGTLPEQQRIKAFLESGFYYE